MAHHQYLSEALDGYSIDRILSVCRSLAGLSCLVVGAGAGSVAAWLATEVGEQGRVVAVDKHPAAIPWMNRLTVLAHDITTERVPHPPYDLVHARLVLQHLPERVEVLRTLANALIPGGALIVEDWDLTWHTGLVLRTPSEADRRLFEFFHETLANVYVEAGVDPGWASRCLEAMVEAGLVDVEAKLHSESWAGASAGCFVIAGIAAQLQEKLIQHGLTAQELDRLRELLVDRRVVVRAWPLVSTVGYRR